MEEAITNPQQEPSLLLSNGFCGLYRNKVLDLSLELLLLTFRLSKINELEMSRIEEIKENMINNILAISAKLGSYREYNEKDIIKFRYCLCVFMDEIIMRNELFMNSSWAHSTLTVRLFDETLGGNNFYDIVKFWLNNPANNKDFLEFIYTCLVLGYKGKYSEKKDVEERVILLCNNIASAITPLLDSNPEMVFEKKFNPQCKESRWNQFWRLHTTKTLLILPLVIIFGIFFYSVFDLETNNARTSAHITQMLSAFTNDNESPH